MYALPFDLTFRVILFIRCQQKTSTFLQVIELVTASGEAARINDLFVREPARDFQGMLRETERNE